MVQLLSPMHETNTAAVLLGIGDNFGRLVLIAEFAPKAVNLTIRVVFDSSDMMKSDESSPLLS
jgi:hypothetical protein